MTQQQIIEESLLLFAHHGYENTSLSNIAERVGIKKPSLYNHFRNKEAIFSAVLQDVEERELEVLENITSSIKGCSIENQLHTIYRNYLDHMATSTEGLFFKRVTLFPQELFANEIKQVFLRVEQHLTSIVEQIFEKGKHEHVLRDVPSEVMTSAFYTLIDGLFLEENFYDKEVFEKRKQASWQIFWQGIQV